jgi:hypothetical protein
MPALQRGGISQFGWKPRKIKKPLGKLVSYEMGNHCAHMSEVQKWWHLWFYADLPVNKNGLTMWTQTVPMKLLPIAMDVRIHSALVCPSPVNNGLTCMDACACPSVTTTRNHRQTRQRNQLRNLPSGTSCLITEIYKRARHLTTRKIFRKPAP